MKKTILFLCMLLVPVCASAGPGTTAEGNPPVSMTCEKGLFSIDLRVRDHELRAGENTLDLTVRDSKNSAVFGAGMTITPWMPDMGHGVPDKAVITDKGNGNYTADNVVLNMGGLWELKVKIQKNGMEDSCIFTFRKVKSAGSHK